MADDKARMPGMFDPQALFEAQTRSIEAFTSAGRIVAEGMRTCADKQMAMMQGFWQDRGRAQTAGSEKTAGGEQAAGGVPADLERRMAQAKAVFETVVRENQELMQHLMQVQAEAMAVLNACAARNMEALGGQAPDLAQLQKTAAAAMEAASRQAMTAMNEIRERMSGLQAGTQGAAEPASAPESGPSGRGTGGRRGRKS